MSFDFSELPRRSPLSGEQLQQLFAELIAADTWHQYSGSYGEQLSTLLREEYRTEHCTLCCSGTIGVELALRGAGVRSGDEVIMAAYDFRAGLVCTQQIGAQPVLVDVLPEQPVIDAERVAAAITPRTRAILVSHLHGTVAPLRQLREIADTSQLSLIEDACQSPGLSHEVADRVSDAVVLSFGGSKLLTAGRGGAVLTSSAAIAQRIRIHTWRGNEAVPMSELQAALLIPQLQQLHEVNAARAAAVRAMLTAGGVDLPFRMLVTDEFRKCQTDESGRALAVFYKLPLLLPSVPRPEQRERLLRMAQERGIPLGTAFQALHGCSARSRFRAEGSLDGASNLADRLLLLHHSVLQPDHSVSLLQELVQILS